MSDLLEQALGSAPKHKKVEDKRKHGIARHVIHHHHDGTHHIEVHPVEGGEPMHLGAADTEALHDHLEHNLNGPPTEDELATIKGSPAAGGAGV